jgi:hypothetical protein
MAIEAIINIAQWVEQIPSTSGHRTGTHGVLGLARKCLILLGFRERRGNPSLSARLSWDAKNPIK